MLHRRPHAAALLILVAACGSPESSPTDQQYFYDYRDGSGVNFTTYGAPMASTHVVWCTTAAPSDISQADADASFAAAFDTWAGASTLTFEKGSCDGSQIGLGFYEGDHGDGETFDGTGTEEGDVLAHTFPNGYMVGYDGEIHFDEADSWTTSERASNSPPADIETIALHEIGHALGLGHSSDPDSVMYESYMGSRRDLAEGDITGIQALYPKGCGCPDISAVGIAEDGTDSMLEAFLNAYARSQESVGCPSDEGGSQYVHDLRGVYLQDFKQTDSECPDYGTDGASAIVYQPFGDAAFLIKEGFWGVYKCLQYEGEANGGAVLLGAPENEEYEHPTYHKTWQDFDSGYMWWDDDDDSVHLHVDSGASSIDFDQVSACATWTVSNDPGPESLVVTYPNGGEEFELGETITLTWESEDTSGSVNVCFYKGPNLDATDPQAVCPGEPLADTGSYEGMTFYGDRFMPGEDDYYLCVSDADDSPWDCGGHFSIVEDSGYRDDDSDGYDTSTDCDDSDSSVNPGEAEVVGDAIDQDCDGSETCYDDDDNDGYLDTTGDTRVSADDDCSDNYEGRSTDSTTDCDDTDAAISPADAEVCGDSVDNDCDGSTDEGCGATTVELCVSVDSASGYSCADWVSGSAGVAGASCDLDYAEDGELWVSTEGWTTTPVATDSGSFTEICGTVDGESGDTLYVNGRFVSSVTETPDFYFYGEWWWCANWYGDGATAGTFTVDGVAVTPTVYDPGTGGFDCLVEIP